MHTVCINPRRIRFARDPMLYGHFLEHFHRQIYGGVFQPGHPLADEEGFRTDVLEAMRAIRTPVIRWPGGCFVSSYHWYKGVGKKRTPFFDKAWRLEDDNSFGTDEFVALCRKLGCEPYICTNAGTGTAEEMSDWMEYCNLKNEGEFAKMRIEGGHPEPYNVKYWSIGNENYGWWEIGAKGAEEWGRLVLESAKMMKHVDPTAELSAAALSDTEWNVKLLSSAGKHLDWISIHGYWDMMAQVQDPASYEACMAYTDDLEAPVRRVRGLLAAYGLEKDVRIAFDEWNLRSWHHPNVHTLKQGVDPDTYIKPRDLNDDNSVYTVADAVFSACFLNMALRNADIVGMTNFAPVVNTRGAIFTHDKGIVLRSTYHVFDMYANRMGDQVLDMYEEEAGAAYRVVGKDGREKTVDCVDIVATCCSDSGVIAVSAVNKHMTEEVTVRFRIPGAEEVTVESLTGRCPDDYNDIDRNFVVPFANDAAADLAGDCIEVTLPAHSVNIIRCR